MHQLEKWPCPQWEEGSLPKLLAAPQTPRQALQVPGDLAEKQQSQRQLRVSREAKGYRENPDPTESETAPPTTHHAMRTPATQLLFFKNLLF